MKKSMELIISNRKVVLTLLVAYVLYFFANPTGYGTLQTLVSFLINGFVFYLAASWLMRTAVSGTKLKGKKLRFVFEDATTTKEKIV
ncbi:MULTISPECIES: hypothetical protein [unclassified Exiguobacterium]|uniref:hypothetical protein n=1 Tax=unclassified Exiguobacterium TaxID=2644629 RepID=UPI001BEC9157|nr:MULTISPECIES: hypothetical protein [unclassified Exiguobacterium]